MRERTAAEIRADEARAEMATPEWGPVRQPPNVSQCRLDYSGVSYVICCLWPECGYQGGPAFSYPDAKSIAGEHRQKTHGLCAVQRCLEPGGRTGVCNKHHKDISAGKIPQPVVRKLVLPVVQPEVQAGSPARTCKVPGCELWATLHSSKCRAHHLGKPTAVECGAEGCRFATVSKNLCSTHYARLRAAKAAES
jgi:hypothetical protein